MKSVELKLLALLGGVVLALPMLSCQRIEPADARGPLAVETLPSRDSIPAEYGRLVGLTAGDPGWAGLFFEKPDQTLVVVWVDSLRGNLRETVTVIPRR